MVGVILIDLQKAFDTVDHSILLRKLCVYGCSEQAVKWFHSYLSGRSQHVSMNNVKSESSSVKCGVPQGAILAPLMFSYL